MSKLKEITFQGKRHYVNKEIEAAADWWAKTLDKTHLPNEQVELFKDSLVELLFAKMWGHWWVENPLRGNAYRSLIYDQHNIDKIILKAAQKAFISNIHKRLPTDGFVMWVDPGSVSVKNLLTTRIQVVYAKEDDLSADQQREPSLISSSPTASPVREQQLTSKQDPASCRNSFRSLANEFVTVNPEVSRVN